MWLGFGGFALVVSFFLFSGFLPTFGAIRLEKANQVMTVYRGYDVSCVYDRGDMVLSFKQESEPEEHSLLVRGGTNRGQKMMTDGAVWFDGIFLGTENCRRHRIFTAQYGGSRGSLRVYEYQLELDCDVKGTHLQADIHEYNCWHK